MELFTEEIDGFNRSITKLEKLTSNLRNTKIQADSKIIESMLDNYMYREEFLLKFYKKQIEEINKKLKWGKLLLILFCLASGVTVFTIGYFGYQVIQLENKKEEAFIKGKKEIISQLRGYFDDYPDMYKDFQKWSKAQDNIPGKK